MTCPVHNWPLKDKRGCWECLDELRIQGKAKDKAASRKQPTPLRQVSAKQAKRNREMAKTKQEIEATRPAICAGCGKASSYEIRLSPSHIISKQQCEDYGRDDLYSHPDNIALHCMDWGEHTGCHTKWESNTLRVKLLDYTKNMLFIRKHIRELNEKMVMNEFKIIRNKINQ